MNALAAVVLIFGSVVAGPASGGQQAQITGSVVNGTSGATVPSDLKVIVAGLADDGTELQRVETPLTTEGLFSVELDATSVARFVLATTHLGVTYSLVIDAAEASSPVTLTIHEVTADESVITVVSDTLTVVRGDGSDYEILQVVRIRNASDRTLAGATPSGRPTLVRLPVAAEATDVTPGEGLDARLTGEVAEGLATSQPIYPGETSLTYFYKLKGIRAGLRIDKTVVYATERAHILAGPGLNARAAGFEFVEERKLGSANYRRYSSGPLAAGAAVVVDVAPTAQASRGTEPAFAIAGLIGVAVLLTLALIARTRGRKTAGGKNQTIDRQDLVRRIALLDEQHAAGRVNDEDYRVERARMKEKLIELES